MTIDSVDLTREIRSAQKDLTDRLVDEAHVLASTALEARRAAGIPDPDGDAWARRWLDYAHAKEFLHLAMMVPGASLHEAPMCMREMLAHPLTDQPATVREMVTLWRMTEPLATYRLPWLDPSQEGIALDLPELGQVHESIMNHIGVIPDRDMVELAKNRKRDKGVYLAPEPLEPWQDTVVVKDKAGNPIRHKAGDFVLIPAGTGRQRSASFYTPQVLADFTIEQGIEVLGEQRELTSWDLLSISICEPSAGTGAIAIPAVRTVAERYLQARQEELGKTIPPEEYMQELQKAKRHVATHQLYAVDLNGSALNVLEMSLWVDTIIPNTERVIA